MLFIKHKQLLTKHLNIYPEQIKDRIPETCQTTKKFEFTSIE
jgi:hypothetical protein